MPDDLSIVGFDDIRLSSLMQPPLTTVSVSRPLIAEEAFTALYEMTEGGKSHGVNRIIPCELVLRASTAPVGS